MGLHFGDERLLPRFWDKVSVEPNTGCWLWTACTADTGYGQFAIGRRMLYAHRVAYAALVGPVPGGLQLDHVRARGCGVRCCVNPEHLEPVTQRENLRRGDAAKSTRSWCAAITHCPNGHVYDDTNTYHFTDRNGYACRRCKTCRKAQLSASRARQRERRPRAD